MFLATLDGRKSSNIVRSQGADKLVQEITIDNLKSQVVREVIADRLVQVNNTQQI